MEGGKYKINDLTTIVRSAIFNFCLGKTEGISSVLARSFWKPSCSSMERQDKIIDWLFIWRENGTLL